MADPGAASPSAGSVLSAAPFLDRTVELGMLQDAFDRAANGSGSLVLIGGEGGIGKTRLVDELVRRTTGYPRNEHPQVAWGRCWDSGGAPSLWPWTCVLRELAAPLDPPTLRECLGAAAPLLAALVPQLREALPDLETEPAPDFEQARFVLFDALAGFLRRAGERRPLLIGLDDIHAADQLSLLALLFVAPLLAEMRVLVIGTHREHEDQYRAVAPLFAKLLRAGQRISLSGLGADQLEQLIEHRGGTAADPKLARRLHHATGGNPFFADEFVRTLLQQDELDALLDEEAPRIRIPAGVRALIEQRVGELPAETMRALNVAAVIGGRFALGTVAKIDRSSAPELLETLQPAIEARVIQSHGEQLTTFAFVHDLIRETVYTRLAPLERARIHMAVGEAMAQHYAGSDDQRVDELAHHFLSALPVGDPAGAVDYSEAAADLAMRRFAHERAARLFTAAAEALELVEGLPEQRRAERRARLLMGRGKAQLRVGDNAAGGTLLEAASAARVAQSPVTLANVALAFGAFALSPQQVDVELTNLLEEALAEIGEEPSALRVHLLARLARALYWSDEEARRRQLIDEAIGMARRLADPEALAIALGNCIPASRGPDTAELELRWIDELLALRDAPGELLVIARSIEIDLLLERGALAAADAAIDSLEYHAARLHDLRAQAYVPVQRARRAIMHGRYDDAAELIDTALVISRDIEESTIPLIIAGQRFGLEWLRDEADVVERELRQIADALPYMPVWRVGLGLLRMANGDRAHAAGLFDRLAGNGFDRIPRNNQWMITLTLAAHLCAQLDDQASAGALYELLLPYAELTSVSPAGGYAGPVARYLGLLAQTRGDRAAAEAHLRAALESAHRQRALPMIALISIELAQSIGDRPEATALLGQAHRLARELNSPAVAARAEAALGGRAPSLDAGPASPGAAATLSREGEVWSFQLSGRTLRVRDSKGVRHLARLLAQPGVEIHALDLAGAAGGEPGVPPAVAAEAGLSVDAGAGAGSALDSAAKAAYRRRLEDLREEVEEAVRWGDPERAAHAREEMEFIADELAGAVGLGGRDRPQASAAERARVNATRAIKAAIRRMAAQDAELGAELEATIHTGLFCRHQPDSRQPVHWQVHGA